MRRINIVIHAAGIIPNMCDEENILRGNVLGTINVNSVFFELTEEGSCFINVSSFSVYMVPNFLLPKRLIPFCSTNTDLSPRKIKRRINLLPKKSYQGFAYCISKKFLVWYKKIRLLNLEKRNQVSGSIS